MNHKYTIRQKSDWNAQWIWLDYITPIYQKSPYIQTQITTLSENEKNRWGLFRKVFSISAEDYNCLESAPFFISCDGYYQLFINEQFVGRGMYRSNRYHPYYDKFDLKSVLKIGTNIIGIIAQYYGESMSWYEPLHHGGLSNPKYGKGQLIFELQLTNEKGNVVHNIYSDKTTRGHICDAWAHTLVRSWIGLPYLEIFDANRFPYGWMSAEFDQDTKPHEWAHTIEIDPQRSYPILRECDIPRLSETLIYAKQLLTAGKIDPMLTEDELQEMQDDPPENPADHVDFFINMGISHFEESNPAWISQWNSHHLLPLELEEGTYGLVWEMEKEFSGFIFFELEWNPDSQDASPIIIDLGWSEKLNKSDAIPSLNTDPYEFKYGMEYICKPGKNRYEMMHWHGFRYLQINIRNRNTAVQNVKIGEVGVNQYLYPVENKGSFHCNDPCLDQLVDVSRWTLRNCMHDGYEDCPSREQRQWIGDAYPEILVNFALFGDTLLAEKLIRQGAESQRGDGLIHMATPGDHEIHGLIIPDYSLYWIMIISEYYRYTGDRTVIEENLPTIFKIIRWFLQFINPHSGLLTDVPYFIFIDWSDNDKWGASCALNAQFYHVLQIVIDLANVVGWSFSIESYYSFRDHLLQSMDRYFWDVSRQAYIDAVETNQSGEIIKVSPKVSFHSNTFMILFDLAPIERIHHILSHVFDIPLENLYVHNAKPLWADHPLSLKEDAMVIMAEPFFMFHVQQMFAKVNRPDLIIRYIQNGWCKMIQLGATTLWESWSNGGSLCHAWSTSPARDLIQFCLGIQIIQPLPFEVKIAPMLMGLTHAEGSMPTILGLVEVSWRRDDVNKIFELRYNAPNSIRINIQPPEIQNGEILKQDLLSNFTDSHHPMCKEWQFGINYHYD